MISEPTIGGHAVWPETPVKKKCKEIKLTSLQLQAIVDAVDVVTGSESGIGTFHVSAVGNIKVKYDKNTGEHYIWACLK